MLASTVIQSGNSGHQIHDVIIYKYIYLTQNKMNLFVLSGHGSKSFAAFLNGVILQKNNAAVITTHHESE